MSYVIHQAAMEAGLADYVWSLEEVIALLEALSPGQGDPALRALGGGTQSSLGCRGAEGSRKKAWPEPLDIEAQGWHHSYPETLMDKAYVDAVRLLLETIPSVFHTPSFVMMGGTAINLFVQDMPRLNEWACQRLLAIYDDF